MEYDLARLVELFDTRVEGHTGLTGRLSSLIGEALLLDGLAHAYAAQGKTVGALPDRPHRDDDAFRLAGAAVPTQRDLDAWLVLDGTRLVAVECKFWTSSSIDGKTIVAGQLEDAARREWVELETKHLASDRWNSINKVALPLKMPAGLPEQMPERVLAVWRPVAADGRSPWSECTVEVLVDGALVPTSVNLFSMSLYARELLRGGVPRIPSLVSDVRRAIEQLDAVCPRELRPSLA